MRVLFKPVLTVLLAGALALAGCSATGAGNGGSGGVSGGISGDGSPTHTDSADNVTASVDDTMFDASHVHTIAVEVDDADLRQLLQTYVDSGDKTWISATVTIDGTQFDDVGIKLKGNSSLRNVSTSSAPETLPWRIRLDKYVDGQNLDGYSDFTVRSNSSETSMNEAVALDLLSDAGLATEHAVQTRFSVNGSDETLRLTVQNLDDTWVQQNFPDAGSGSILYKSDADGDWSWRGTDGDYTSSFDIESGPDDYSPLIELLDLLTNGTTEEITEKLPHMVDLDSFATYLAFEELIDNFDDIDGPGNNSYLFWNSDTQQFTVVAWDHNMAFGSGPGGGNGMPGGMPDGAGDIPDDAGQVPADAGRTPPDAATVPSDADEMPQGEPGQGQGMRPPGGGGTAGDGRGGGPGGTDNPLVDAFDANTTWKALQTSAASELQTSLIDSGTLDASVDAWTEVLESDATDLVDKDTITSEADAIRTYGQ